MRPPPSLHALRTTLSGMIAAVIACALLAGCPKDPPSAPAPQAGAPTPSPRIVSLSPAISVILRDLGHERSIVGRHAYDPVLSPTLPACGDQTGIDYEPLVRAKPTHVFTQWGSRELPERLTTLAGAQGWTLRDIPILSVDDIGTAIATLDRSVRGAQDDAPVSPTALQLQTALNNLAHPATRPDRSGAGKVLILISTAPPTALGPGSAHDQLLRALGATPALTDAKPYTELTHEQLVKLAPDAIILFWQRTPQGQPDAATEAGATPKDDPWKPLRPLNLPALNKGHAAVIDDPLALVPGTSLIPVGEKMKTLLSEWDAH
ncbi:MAG: hypothetical protein U0637_03265 [Phycisphaerales bacterium]